MKVLRLYIELEYDESVAHGDEPEAIEWFMSDVIHGDDLSLYSDKIGDTVGSVRVLRDDEATTARDAEWVAAVDALFSGADEWMPASELAIYAAALTELKARMTGEK